LSRTLLIDADILAYKASAANERRYKWPGTDGTSVAAELDKAQETAEETLDALIDRLKADNVIICLSDDFRSFRKELVDPTYKSARLATERPQHLYDMKDWLRSQYDTEQWPLLEADDVMGIIATDPSRTDERIIVSADKDMMTVPGKLYRPQVQGGSPRPRIFDITPLEAIRFHFWQTITGDTTDGFPGVKGLGKESIYAEAVLEAETEEEAWDYVLMAYGSKGLDEPAAVQQARLARILQHPDYPQGRISLWLPPVWEEPEPTDP